MSSNTPSTPAPLLGAEKLLKALAQDVQVPGWCQREAGGSSAGDCKSGLHGLWM